MPFTTKQLEESLTAKLMLNFSKTPEEAMKGLADQAKMLQ